MKSRIWLGLVALGLTLAWSAALAGPKFTGMKVYINQNNYAKAAALGQAAIDEDPDSPDIYNKYGIALAEIDSLEHAGEVFGKGLALAQQQKNDELVKDILQNRTHYYAKCGNRSYQLLTDAQTLRDSLPANADSKNPAVKAVQDQVAGMLKESIVQGNKALALNPTDEKMWTQMGVAYSYLGQDDEAMKAYNQALKINPNYQTALSNVHSAKIRAAERAKTAKEWDKAAVIYTALVDGGDTASLLDLGDIYYSKAKGAAEKDTAAKYSNMRMAAGYFGKYSGMHPEDTVAVFNYFVALQNAHDTTAALAIAKKMVARGPYRKDLHGYLLSALAMGHNNPAKIAEQWALQGFEKGKLLAAPPPAPAATDAGKLKAKMGVPDRVYTFVESGQNCAVWFYEKVGAVFAFLADKQIGKSSWMN